MPKIGRIDVCTPILLLVLCWLAATEAHSTNDTTTTLAHSSSAVSKSTAPSSLAVQPAISSVSTCPSGTVNYITHTLPQQCLRTSRSALGNSTNTVPPDGFGTAANLTTASLASVATEALASNYTVLANQTAPEPDPTPGSSIATETTLAESTGDPPIPTPSSVASPPEPEQETDSPLDNSKFLSFEEWKNQNLAKVGQSPENVGKGRATGGDGQRRPVMNNALDSLGDDGEIELDFGGFGATEEPASRWSSDAESSQSASDTPPPTESLPASGRARNKDAGKTCKERFNYASFDCAATVLKTNPKCKSATSVLVENKDSYMLNECGTGNKFLIVELCDDILVDTIVLANFEFFSSMFRTFRVSVSDRYPVKLDRWKDLGTFEARNTREIQAFLVQNPLIWARYLRIEFLTHYGGEFYCPVSLVRVHGTTMMEEFRHQDDVARGEDEIEDEVADPVVQIDTPQEPQPVEQISVTTELAAVVKETGSDSQQSNSTIATDMPPMSSSLPIAANTDTSSIDISETMSSPISPPDAVEKAAQPLLDSTSLTNDSTTTTTTSAKISTLPPPKNDTTEPAASGQSRPSLAPSPEHNQGLEAGPASQYSSSTPSFSVASASEHKPSSSAAVSASSKPERKLSPSAASPVNVKGDTKSIQSPPEVIRPSPTIPQQPATPTTQESFFKSVHKRLQMLEANSTLSLQYIEEQSRILRDAFMQVEKRQLLKTEKFLGTLNDSVLTELKWFRQQYDQLWQSTVIELSTHEAKYQREMLAISSRLTIMADELVFQKRMIVVQSTLLLLCLGLVIFVRSGSNYLELPLMQQVMNKSHSMLKLSFESPPGSPTSRDSSPGLRKTRRLVRQSSGTSEGSLGSPIQTRSEGSPVSTRNALHPSLQFSPPTPEGGYSDRSRSPTPAPSPEINDLTRKVRQTRSGPATPSGTRETLNPLDWDDSKADSVLDGDEASAGDGEPQLQRESDSSELEGSTADRHVARSERDMPPQKLTVSSASSNNGDTIGEILFTDGFSD